MPFRIKAGNACGPGTFDMKGGLVQALFALETLQGGLKIIVGKIRFTHFDVLPDLGGIPVSGGRFDGARIQFRINPL